MPKQKTIKICLIIAKVANIFSHTILLVSIIKLIHTTDNSMKKLLSYSFICLFIIPSLSYGSCNSINISITNVTGDLCKLEGTELKHGYLGWVANAPVYLPTNSTTDPLVLKESYLGADLNLTYTCGNDKKITLSIQHDYDFFASGEIKGSVIFAKNMKAENRIKRGSCLWNQHGTIDWLIE